MIDRVFGFLPFADRWLDFELRHGDVVAYAAIGALQIYLIARREEAATAAVGVLAVLFALNNDSSAYHFIWILAFGLLAGHRGFVAALTVFGTGQYLVLAFVSGGSYQSPLGSLSSDWLIAHNWYFNVGSWVVFAIWAARILLRPTPEGHANP